MGEWRYSSTYTLTSTVDGGEWTFGFRKGREFVDQLGDYQLLKEDSTPLI
jgi:hypothetical protein